MQSAKLVDCFDSRAAQMSNPPIVVWQDVLPYLMTQVERIPATSWVGILTFLGGVVLVWRTNAQHIKRLRIQLAAEDARHLQRLQQEAESQRTGLEAESHRLRVQLQHDSEERARDRLMSMRRDVYLTELVSLNQARQKLLNAIKEGDTNDVFFDAANAAFRISMVSEADTRKLALKLASAYNEASGAANELCTSVGAAKAEAAMAESNYKYLLEARASVTQKRAALLDGPKSPDVLAKFQGMEQQIEWYTPRLEEAHRARLSAHEAVGVRTKEAIEKFTPSLMPSVQLLHQLEKAISVELGIKDRAVD